MNARVRELVERLELTPHPEGGWYREIHRSEQRVTLSGGAPRSALTTIHFLLARGTRSRWHRVTGEELWHFQEGEPLELLWLGREDSKLHRRVLGSDASHPHVEVIPAGSWQAARPLGDYALLGCTMGPGFEFSDFTLLADHADAEDVRRRFPELADLI